MNKRFFDLIYNQNDPKGPKADQAIKKLQEIGFRIKPLSESEYLEEFKDLPPAGRFCCKELSDAGVENVFAPKPEIRTRLLNYMMSGGN